MTPFSTIKPYTESSNICIPLNLVNPSVPKYSLEWFCDRKGLVFIKKYIPLSIPVYVTLPVLDIPTAKELSRHGIL